MFTFIQLDPDAPLVQAFRNDSYIRHSLWLLLVWDYGELTSQIFQMNQCLTVGPVISFDQEVSRIYLYHE